MTNGTRRGWGGQRHAPAALYPRGRPGTHCIGGWVGPRAGLERRGKSRPPTRFRSQDRPARSQSLYQLSYPANHVLYRSTVNEMRVIQKYDGQSCYRCRWNIFIPIEKVWSVRGCASEVHLSFLQDFEGIWKTSDAYLMTVSLSICLSLYWNRLSDSGKLQDKLK